MTDVGEVEPLRLENEARSILREAVGLEAADVALLGHYQHPVLRVTAPGTDAVLKLFPRDDARAKREIAGLRLLGGEGSPRLLAEGTSATRSFVLSTRVPGLDLRRHLLMPGLRAEAAARRAGEAAARLLPSLHERLRTLDREPSLLGRDPMLSLHDPASSPARRLAPLLHESLGRTRIEGTLRCLADCEVFAALLADQTIAHGDFQAKNLMLDDEGRLNVLDWEFLRLGPRVSDYVTLVRHLPWTDELTKVLLGALGGFASTARDLRRLFATYDLVKVTLGLSSDPGDSPDLGEWLGYVDACLAFLANDDWEGVQAARRRVLAVI